LQQLRGLEAVSGPVSRLIRKSRRVGSVRGRRHHQSDVPSNDQPARRHKHGVVADPSQLRSKGKRMTRQRRLIWDTFVAEGDGHLTADDVVDRVREQLPHVNPSTVYRTLELLVDEGLLLRTDLRSDRSHYELAREHAHHHLVCERCGAITHFHDDVLGDLAKRIKRSSGYTLSGSEITLFGLCRTCGGPRP
jgi:Fur family transcriptional regulator, ferric uptake regulator